VVVMLFDEQGQAASYERKIEVTGRSYRLLTGDGFPPEDIVFDPNVFAVATGIPEHDRYALDFIRACAWIKANCPGSQISGGISNLSFSFRGSEPVREAMHSVFLKHAAGAGLTMAIVNPAALVPYDRIDPSLREAAEEVILFRDDSAGARLLAIAMEKPAGASGKKDVTTNTESWRSLPPEERIIHAMVKGIDDYIEADVLELKPKYPRSLDLMEGPLMKGMEEVGERFGAGKMFLPQVIRSARVMKRAFTVLEASMDEEKAAEAVSGTHDPAGTNREGQTQGARKILLATVKGDVHDIGKNIVAVVLGCNGYEVLDLGVMIPPEQILAAAEEKEVRIIGLSGLITPSLDEMVRTARDMEKRGLTIPLLIGGATTSLAHTALRIAPEYSGPVVYVPDASRSVEVVRSLLSDTERPRFLEELEQSYREAAKRHERIQTHIELIPLEAARKNRVFPANDQIPADFNLPMETDSPWEFNDYPINQVIPHIDWRGFLRTWDMEKTHPEAEREEAQKKLLEDARVELDRIIREGVLTLRGVAGFFPARSRGDDIILYDPANREQEIARFSFLRNQERKRTGGPNPCLADFIAPEAQDQIGLFALSSGFGLKEAEAEYRARGDDYGAILLASLADSLAEAFAEALHRRFRRDSRGIRPAFGYPACPDHRDKETAFALLQARERCGLALTESAMIIPAASVCGMYFAHPGAYYFGTGAVGEDQLRDWAERKGISPEEARRRIGRI
jgi:5-methyltetrahydrofolate--homocysteine methyltransferase